MVDGGFWWGGFLEFAMNGDYLDKVGKTMLMKSATMKKVRKRTARTVRTMLQHDTPYPHEHSQHAVLAVIAVTIFFTFSDDLHIVLHKLDTNIKWWLFYGCLLFFFYFFSSPFLGRTIQPSYSNFSRWWV